MKIYTNEQQIEQVSQFKYLGSLMTEDWILWKRLEAGSELQRKYFKTRRSYLLDRWTWTCLVECSRNVDFNSSTHRHTRSFKM